MRHVPFLIAACVLLAAIHIYNFDSVPLPKADQSFGSVIRSVEKPQTELATSSILFTGDVLLARDVEQYMSQYGNEYPFRFVTDWLNDFDIVVGNFEASIPEVHQVTKPLTMNFSVASSAIPALKGSGFTHLSLANNHTFDFGQADFEHTESVLADNGLETVGKPAVFGGESIEYIPTSVGVVALIAFDLTSDQYTAAELRNVLKEADFFADHQIAYVHWGEEYELQNSQAQAEIAHDLIDAGIDLVIGHHPHVVQNIEVYKNKVIVYSLGNFIFDQYFSTEVQLGLAVALVEQESDIQLNLYPVSSLNHRVSPAYLDGREGDVFLKELAGRSSPQVRNMISGGRLILDENLAVSPQID